MEVKVKHIKCDMNTKDKELMNKFMKFLQNILGDLQLYVIKIIVLILKF